MNRLKTDPSGIVKRTMLFPAGLHVREAAEGEAPSRVIEGYAIVFGVLSAPFYKDEEGEMREIIAPEAVTRELLDNSDIKMTMFHDRQLILARSNMGRGTLSYEIDDHGVKFSFEAPATVDGDKALELVRRGDLAGCSFAFSTRYYDETCVSHDVTVTDGYAVEVYTVRVITGVYDFTLAADPAYPDTSVEAREFAETLRAPKPKPEVPDTESYREQVAAMRTAARKPIV